MSHDTRATSGMAPLVGIGAVAIALFSVDWKQVAIDLCWFLIDWILHSGERFVNAVVAAVQFIFS